MANGVVPLEACAEPMQLPVTQKEAAWLKAKRLHPRGSRSTYHSRSFDIEALQGTNMEMLEESWRLRDIDIKFIFTAQHYGTAVYAIFIIVALAVSHYIMKPKQRPFFVYDASISYTNYDGDTIPAYAAIITPLGCLALSLFAYEFIIFKSYNRHISNAVATMLHFLVDAVCAFVTVIFITELTKFLAGRLRPNFLQRCHPNAALTGDAVLGSSTLLSEFCADDGTDMRKSFPSGHSSSSAVLMVYNVVYLIWAGYFRAGDSSFMGLQRQTGWRGGHRVFRELGHGTYLFWILLQLAFTWGVGVSRFNDNKHHPSDIIAGWILGSAFAMVYAIRACNLQQYVLLHNIRPAHAGLDNH